MTYTNFDQILRESNLNEVDRIIFTQQWLQKNYNIDVPINAQWVNELTGVHNHDNLPKHYGQLKLATAFENLWIQVTKINANTYRLAVIRDINDVAGTSIVLNPVQKGVAENPVLTHVRTLLDKMSNPRPKNVPPARKFSTFDDLEVASGDLESVPLTEAINPSKTKTVDIDLSSYLP